MRILDGKILHLDPDLVRNSQVSDPDPARNSQVSDEDEGRGRKSLRECKRKRNISLNLNLDSRLRLGSNASKDILEEKATPKADKEKRALKISPSTPVGRSKKIWIGEEGSPVLRQITDGDLNRSHSSLKLREGS